MNLASDAMRIDTSLYPTLQDAVNALPVGGTLVVPPGEWKCGPALLKSHMTLRLAKGARLVAPERIDQCMPIPRKSRKTTLDYCFLGFFGCEDVTIEGEGEIICQGHCFWEDYDGAPDSTERNPQTGYWLRGRCYRPKEQRPVSIQLLESRNVNIRGITIHDAAAYTIWALGCDFLRLENLHLKHVRLGPNTDGLDIDCCSNVWISGCLLETGDDCIALKSDIALLGYNKPCEHIFISNNTMSSKCCGIRIGYEGDGIIRDVVMENVCIYDSNIGIDMLSLIPKRHTFDIHHGSQIENITIKSVSMRNVKQAIKLWSNVEEDVDKEDYQGYIRHVLLSDMFIEAVDSSFIGGLSVSDVHLRDIQMNVMRFPKAHSDEAPVALPDVWGAGYLPQALTIYNAPDTRLENVAVTEGIQE